MYLCMCMYVCTACVCVHLRAVHVIAYMWKSKDNLQGSALTTCVLGFKSDTGLWGRTLWAILPGWYCILNRSSLPSLSVCTVLWTFPSDHGSLKSTWQLIIPHASVILWSSKTSRYGFFLIEKIDLLELFLYLDRSLLLGSHAAINFFPFVACLFL